ncbi:MAG: hypothetical protein CMN84_10085 [Spongiibacteraceae bacterium]|jgi:hypothetical protein|nr:hypothetical protein [Spongiibacteraceae bacterium]
MSNQKKGKNQVQHERAVFKVSGAGVFSVNAKDVVTSKKGQSQLKALRKIRAKYKLPETA